MKKISLVLLILCGIHLIAKAQTDPTKSDPTKYVFERDDQVREEQAGPHKGSGQTVGHSFFDKAPDYHTAFKKRILKSGSSIGYHLQKEDEVYYIIEGNGLMKINGETFAVKPGDAILTRPGSSHGIAPLEGNDLVIIIVYEKLKKE